MKLAVSQQCYLNKTNTHRYFRWTEEEKDSFLAFAAMFQFVVLMTQLLVIHLFGITGSVQSALRMFSIGISAIPVLLALPILIKRKPIVVLLTYCTASLVFVLSALFYPDTRSVLPSLFFYLFCMCLPSFLCFACIQNMEAAVSSLTKIAVANFILGACFTVCSLVGLIRSEQYSMSFSYYLLFSACYFLHLFHTKGRRTLLLFSLLSGVFVALLGSRGALVTYFVYAVISAFYFLKWNVRTLILWMILFSLGILFLMYFDQILSWIYDFLLSMGIQSRTLNLLRSNQLLSHDSGRGDIYRYLFQKIGERPFLGYGVGGDRAMRDGGYAHNLFIEVFVDFGVIIGAFLLILLGTFVVRTFQKKDNQALLLLFFCIGIIPLMVSGSFYTETNFWILIGFCFQIVSNVKPSATVSKKLKTSIFRRVD